MLKKAKGFGSGLHFDLLGDSYIGKVTKTNKKDSFKACFGVTPKVVSIVWKIVFGGGRKWMKLSAEHIRCLFLFNPKYIYIRAKPCKTTNSSLVTRSRLWQ